MPYTENEFPRYADICDVARKAIENILDLYVNNTASYESLGAATVSLGGFLSGFGSMVLASIEASNPDSNVDAESVVRMQLEGLQLGANFAKSDYVPTDTGALN